MSWIGATDGDAGDVRKCCEKSNVPGFCQGLCNPYDWMARSLGKRLNACSKYDAVIDKCFKEMVAPKIEGSQGIWSFSLVSIVLLLHYYTWAN